ncbi:hypothetical protein ACFL4H_00185 [Candidatus Neomarinimicrobiota bacterium]
MKIVKWLANAMSSRIGLAIIEVEENESADIDNMLILIDGNSVGHFGIDVNLIATDKLPDKLKYKAPYLTGTQFGYANASTMKKKKRFYKVHVHRD